MSNNENEIEKYMLLLRERTSGRHKNSNLYLVKNSGQTIQQRTSTNISPPTNLNPDYHQPGKKVMKAKEGQKGGQKKHKLIQRFHETNVRIKNDKTNYIK